MHGQVCPGVHRSQDGSEVLAAPLLEVSFSGWFSNWSYVCCDVVAIRCCLLCSLVLAQFGRTHVWTGQGHIFATLQYKRRAPSWIKLKPEDLKEQIGKLAEKGMTPSSLMSR